jgi:hypothetical protein
MDPNGAPWTLAAPWKRFSREVRYFQATGNRSSHRSAPPAGPVETGGGTLLTSQELQRTTRMKLTAAHRTSESLSRRHLLGIGGSGLLGLSLFRLLHSKAESSTGGLVPKADACILVFLPGGPSHLDTWDMKPSAPTEIRGEFQSIATSAPGVRICQHMPRLARLMHHVSIVRSVSHNVRISHGAAAYVALTGHDRGERADSGPSSDDYPAVGSVVGLRRPPRAGGVPYVWMPTATRHGSSSQLSGMQGGWLGRTHDPLVVNPEDDGARTPLVPQENVRADRLNGRMRLLDVLARHDNSLKTSPHGRELRGFQEKAIDLITSPAVQRAFQIDQEPQSVRDSYGDSVYGESALLARRLIEAGTRVACVAMAPDTNQRWDSHSNLFGNYRRILLPELDAALASLISDLAERRMLNRTLVVVMGEFGRTPRIVNDRLGGPGRDHWSRCYNLLLAGGGIKGGYVHGSSDRIGAEPMSCPVTPADVIATVYHCLGVPHELEIRDRLNRPHQLVPWGNPITELLT